MKNLILATLLSLVCTGSITATESRIAYENGHAVMGYEKKPDISWHPVNYKNVPYKSAAVVHVDKATIITYFLEEFDTYSYEDLISGKVKPVCQGFTYEDEEPIFAHNPYIGKLATGEEGFLFHYNERIKIYGTMYDQVRVGTSYEASDNYCIYFLDKYKD